MPNETQAAGTEVMNAPLFVHHEPSELVALRAEPIDAKVFTEGDRIYLAMQTSIRNA